MAVSDIRRALLAVPLLLLAASAAAAGLPAPEASYSAIQTISVGGQEMIARIFHSDGKERREMSMQGMDSVMILDPEHGAAYILQPQLNMAMELPLGGPESGPDPTGLKDMDAVAEGTESVAGLETTRYRVAGVKNGQGFSGLVWATDDGIYARMEGTVSGGGEAAEMRMVLSDVVRGPQDPSLFRLPAGVRIMDMAPLPGRTPGPLRPGG